jgi:sugar/nucleoside kinase (ribokinase family)
VSKFPYKSKNSTPYAIGVGSALMDILLQESESFVTENSIIKGGMDLVGAEKAGELLAKSNNSPEYAPGGSACNTTIGLGRLSGKAQFIGTCGDDDLGKQFSEALIANSVEPKLTTTSTPTGQVLSVITPDAERSMLTYLGAAAESNPADIKAELFEGADVIHIEGYLLFNEVLLRAVLNAAKEAGVLISLDLAAFTVVEAAGDLVKELVKEYVDIVLANEDEARAYTGESDEHKALEVLSKDAELAVVKIGKRGSLISCNGEKTVIAPYGDGNALDTTGAGDLWASGFLYGVINSLSMAKSGELASICGFNVCQIAGAHMSDKTWDFIKSNR